MAVGLVGAFAAAVLYGLGTVLQAVGVRRASASQDTGLWARLWAARLYAVGLGLDALAFLASLAALRTLPLFVVESAIASSVAVTAVLAVAVLGARLRRAETGALAAVAVGLVLLAVSAAGGSGTALGGTGTVLLLGATVAVAALGVLGHLLTAEPGHALLSVVAGLGFGGTGVAARVLTLPPHWWQLTTDPVVWALVGYAVVALVAYGLALARGSVTTTAAITFTVETVVPAAIGLVWLGDSVRPGYPLVAALAFVLTLGGCVLLARHSTGEPERLQAAGEG